MRKETHYGYPHPNRRPSAIRIAAHHRATVSVVAYFLIAFAGTWLAWAPLLLGQDGLCLFSYRFGDASILVAMLGTFTGPLLAAYVVTAATAGKAGCRHCCGAISSGVSASTGTSSRSSAAC